MIHFPNFSKKLIISSYITVPNSLNLTAQFSKYYATPDAYDKYWIQKYLVTLNMLHVIHDLSKSRSQSCFKGPKKKENK